LNATKIKKLCRDLDSRGVGSTVPSLERNGSGNQNSGWSPTLVGRPDGLKVEFNRFEKAERHDRI